MTDDRLHEDIGALKAQVGRMATDVMYLRKDVSMLKSELYRSQGGWKVLVSIGSFFSAIGGGIIVKIWPWH